MTEAETKIKRPAKPVTGALLRLKRRNKAKRPEFKRFESWRYTRLKSRWRKPKGLDNKMRNKRKGWPASPNTGWRTPASVRGLHPSGFYETLVYNIAGLEGLDPKRVALRIAGKVGGRKRVGLLAEARKHGFLVLNPGKASELPEKKAEAEVELKAKTKTEESEGEE